MKNNDEAFNQDKTVDFSLQEKMSDALIPGYQAEFDPDEAEKAGAFVEDALVEQDAIESDIDLINVVIPLPISSVLSRNSKKD